MRPVFDDLPVVDPAIRQTIGRRAPRLPRNPPICGFWIDREIWFHRVVVLEDTCSGSSLDPPALVIDEQGTVREFPLEYPHNPVVNLHKNLFATHNLARLKVVIFLVGQ